MTNSNRKIVLNRLKESIARKIREEIENSIQDMVEDLAGTLEEALKLGIDSANVEIGNSVDKLVIPRIEEPVNVMPLSELHKHISKA